MPGSPGSIDLRYFSLDEFRDWKGRMSYRLLVLEDTLRHMWGAAITVSPVEGALGRHKGQSNTSQHNYDRWGEVRAMDQFLEGMDTRAEAERAVDLMTDIGFTGIGVYPHWHPKPGIHGDVRADEAPGDPALWGMLDDGDGQYQVSIEEALEAMPT